MSFFPLYRKYIHCTNRHNDMFIYLDGSHFQLKHGVAAPILTSVLIPIVLHHEHALPNM